jgi:hypothetical protein
MFRPVARLHAVRAFVAIFAIATLAPQPVAAQPADPSVRFMNAPTTHTVAALRRWRVTGPETEQETSLTFMRVDDPAGGPVRWVVMQTDQQNTYYRWADARRCQGLADRLSFLDAPQDALSPEVAPHARLDRNTEYALTIFRRNWAGSVQYSAQRRVPPTRLETWADDLIRSLQGCWRGDVPAS